MYSEKSKIPWGAIIVVVAVVIFGCIIAGTLLAREFLSERGPITTGTGTTTSAPLAPAGSVAIEISSSNTKEDWMDAMVEAFNQRGITLKSGEVVFATVKHVTSGGSQQDILDGKSTPTVWSPGDASWVEGANQVWRDRTGKPLTGDACPTTVYAPTGFAMWRPMAEALGWPDKPIRWDDIVALAANPDGWASLGHPEWGQFKFGHTHPTYSNVGLQLMTALVYSTLGVTSGLSVDEVYSDEVIEAFRYVEEHTYHYGIQNVTLINLMARRGPNYLHAINSSEAAVLKVNAEQGQDLRFPLVFIFPAGGTFWSEHPYCILETDWVSEKQAEGAALFRDFIFQREQQEAAVTYYLRPRDSSLPLRAPLSLENGTDPRVTTAQVPSLASPSAEVAEAIQDIFFETKKKATVVIVLDTSGSMDGEKIKNATESSANFVSRLDPRDEVYVLVYDSTRVVQLNQGGLAGDVGEELSQTLRGLFARGNTPLYDSVCEATDLVSRLQAEDQANNERRLYGIVLLSDGADTSSTRTQNQMFQCLPSGEDVEGVKIFTIAYGAEADKDLLLRIANRTNGLTFTGDPNQIERIYNAISAEQ